MISNLKPYPAYKDSGVRWLGKVPEHWEVMPVKRALRPQSCGNAAIKNTAVATPLDGYAPAFSASGQDVWLPRALHRGSALVLSAVGARCGKTFRADGEWGVVANTHILWPRAGQNRDYWWYVTNNEAWWDKAGAAQPFVRVSATLERSWVIPPLPEQTAIVRFLDYMDRRIRRSIRAKQKLIKLLEEYRQALIHQAVTGQIDVRTGKPYPAYKDSGVPWLGKVPEHWEVRRLKTAVDHVNQQTTTKTDEDLYIALEHVESWTGRFLPPSGEAHFDGQVKRFQAGDVLFGKLRPYLAKVVRPKQSGVCVGEFLVLRARPVVAALSRSGSAIGTSY